ncbi:hypothetical protein [Swingsia samuiensis]|uniref:hypothetical protein n=1 Tax=Swingsia samuiensis TaxID=1293412 RepID=UPI0015E8D1F3|nr:hypothetical protein [Swingsia samuiensis]
MKIRLVFALILLTSLSACGPDYGSQGTRQFRGDGFGNVGVGVSSYGYQGGPV